MKNTKNLIRLSLIIVLSAVVLSCEIEEYNPSGSTADAVWTTPEGFQTLINAAYSNTRIWYGKIDGIFLSETGTDLWFNKSKDGYAREISKYEDFTPETGNPNRQVWPFLYQAINLCNAGIERIDDAGFPSDEVKNQKEAELRFLRAFYYWHVVETWGGVSLITMETKEPILTGERSPEGDFYELIISDLLFAAEHLPVSHGNEYSRASQKSALGMLARAYLTYGYYLDGEAANEYFRLAREVAKEVIDNQGEYGVELWDDVADMWDPANNADNKEALYVVSNSTNPSLNYDVNSNRLHIWFLTNYLDKPGLQLNFEDGLPDQRRLMPTLFLLDLFDETIDARYNTSFQEVWYCSDESTIPTWTAAEVTALGLDISLIDQDKFEFGDTAMLITKRSIPNRNELPYLVIDRDSVYNTSTDNSIVLGEDYVALKKYMDPYTREAPEARPGFLDIIVIRLAEMYLIAAEAEFQLGNSGEAAGYINVLRTRAAIKTPIDHTNDMQVSESDISAEFILDERARELCGEHIRWFDLKRVFKNDPDGWVDFIVQRNPDIGLIGQIRNFHMLRPVPQPEIDAMLNGDEYGQNPGYH